VNRRDFLATALSTPLAIAQSSSARPNVVLFMTDDHGAWATGYNGCAETPAIDALRRGGVFFSNAFAATPVCSPSRMTYITGKMPSTHGIQDFLLPEDAAGPASPRFLAGQLTYTELLAKSGYTLALCGKWHMGQDETAQAGFTWWATVPGGGGTYRSPAFVKNGQKLKTEGFKTDMQGDWALEFLDGVNRTKPFFLMVPFYAPHTPYDFYPEQDGKAYDGSKFPCFPNTPMNPNQNSNLAKNLGREESKRAYSALVTGADRNIQRILKKLDEMRVRENTLVIFTADQGFNTGHHGVWGKGNGTVPYNMYEESIRVPMIWNHPARIRGGTTADAMISSYDFFPSILEYLGVKAPADSKRVGRSYASFLSGSAPKQWRDRLYFEYAYTRCIRTRTLKYIERTKDWPSELYDLEADPGEKKDVFADPTYASRLKDLQNDLHRFFERSGAPRLEDWRSTTKQHLPERERATPRGG
jgi:arylsulfatase A-like enzyme